MRGVLELVHVRKITTTLLFFGFILSFAFLSSAFAGSDSIIKLIVNGQNILPDVPPQIINDRTMIPVRFVAEALGLDVCYRSSENTVFIRRGNDVVRLLINDKVYKNDVVIPLDVQATIINDRTFVPVRFISEAFGAFVTWDESSKTVVITQDNKGGTSLPKNGTIVKYYKGPATSPVEIKTTSGPAHYFVKVVDWYTKKPVITVFIRSGETYETLIPPGLYEIKYAAGSNWYGEDVFFGECTTFTKTEKQFNFTNTSGYYIELIYQAGGNLDSSEISREEF
jgi:hypothetical protein